MYVCKFNALTNKPIDHSIDLLIWITYDYTIDIL